MFEPSRGECVVTTYTPSRTPDNHVARHHSNVEGRRAAFSKHQRSTHGSLRLACPSLARGHPHGVLLWDSTTRRAARS